MIFIKKVFEKIIITKPNVIIKLKTCGNFLFPKNNGNNLKAPIVAADDPNPIKKRPRITRLKSVEYNNGVRPKDINNIHIDIIFDGSYKSKIKLNGI